MTDPRDILPRTLPCIPFTERHRLPAHAGIYFALSEQGNVLYIGKSKDIRQRWQQHHRMKDLAMRGCTSIAWYKCSLANLDTWESALIEILHPELNGAGTTQDLLLSNEFYKNLEQRRQEDHEMPEWLKHCYA